VLEMATWALGSVDEEGAEALPALLLSGVFVREAPLVAPVPDKGESPGGPIFMMVSN
jgi:hypothetical protein